jgi:hypothetical protein
VKTSKANLEKQLAANLRRLGRCIAHLEQSAHVSPDGWRMLETMDKELLKTFHPRAATDVLARLMAGDGSMLGAGRVQGKSGDEKQEPRSMTPPPGLLAIGIPLSARGIAFPIVQEREPA